MAILGKLDLTEQVDMTFGIDVYGTTEQTEQVRFVIEGSQFDIACKCKIENGEVIANIPKLKGILEAGIHEARLEVVVGGKLFVPLKEQIEINPLIEFDVKTKNVNPVKEGVKVTVKQQIVSEDSKPTTSKLEKNIQSTIKEGYEVSKVGDHYIMKKDDKYFGIISENKILKAKKGFDTVSELVDGLTK